MSPRTPRRPPAAVLGRLYDSLRAGIFLGSLDADGPPPVGVNPHLKLMLGYDRETPVASIRPFSADRFVDPSARAAFLSELRRDGAVADYLLRLRRTDDSTIWVEVTATLRRDADGSGFQIEALLRDVSERRKLEDEGRDLSHQMLQAEKMAALGQTVSGVAHELNNPLATILTWAERLAARGVDAGTRRGLETILSEAERAAKIVRNLLTFARKRNTTRALVDLNAVIRDTLALRAYEQRVSNVMTIEALAGGLPHVFADPHQVKQVLLNLVINAEQAMLTAHGRGTLVIRTWHDDPEEMVVVEISDDGPGVPDEVQEKIFDPFFTTKAVGKGTGLGLTMAYAIVQEHGGQIRVTSGADGAAFVVSLPAAAGPRRPRDATPLPLPPPAASGSSVLVVEDEPALATAVGDALRDAGYRVEHAADGQEALERVTAGVFDLVICDLKMPRLDGPSFYRILSDQKPALARRVVFVTGDVAGTDAERFLIESGCRWLPKPFRLGDLLGVVAEVAR